MKTRAPHEIISDLLWFAEMNLNDLEHPERYEEVKTEGRQFVQNVKDEQAAWNRLFNDPFFKDPTGRFLARDEFRENRRSRHPNYDSGL